MVDFIDVFVVGDVQVLSYSQDHFAVSKFVLLVLSYRVCQFSSQASSHQNFDPVGRVSFSDEVRQLCEQALCGHILGQDAAHLRQEATCRVNITYCAVMALGLDYDYDTILNSLVNHLHKPRIRSWKVTHAIA